MSQIQIFGGTSIPGAANIEFLRGTDGVSVPPNPATHIIDLASIDFAINGSPASWTETFVDLVKWTHFVVDNLLPAPYITIQSAIDAVSTYTNVIDFNIDFVALNSIVATVDTVALTPVVFTVDQATTIAALAAMIGTATGVTSSTVTGARQITVVFASGSSHVVNSVVTTLGASQPTATISSSSAASEELILVRYGTGNYAENLIIPSNITILGVLEASSSSIPVLITGIHTPPSSGFVGFVNVRLDDATAILSSALAGSTQLYFKNCNFDVTNGFVADVANWTGNITFIDCSSSGLDDGLVNNVTGTSVITITDSTVGGGGQVFTTGGNVLLTNSTLNCKSNLVNACAVVSINSFCQAMTFNGTSSADFTGGLVSGAGVAAITQSSAGSLSLVNIAIDSNNNPAIAGAGAGAITMAGVPFLNNKNISGTLTTAVYDWKPYATQGTSVTATVGTASFNEDDFTVVNGFVSSASTSIASNYTNVTTAMSPYTVTATDYFISCDATAGPITIRLPNAPTTKREFVIKDRVGIAATNAISITTVGGAVTIDGATTYTFSDNYESLEMLFNGSSYETF